MLTHHTTLSNGLSVFGLHIPGRTMTALVAFPAGARHERKEENGIAHFLEHMVFKGGQSYTDYKQVNHAADNLGASMNAFTSHDMVAFHIKTRAEDILEGVDLLTDFTGRPLLDADELEQERGVIVQEIAKYADMPAWVVEDLITETVYGDHPLGRSVLGPASNIESFSRDMFVDFKERTWITSQGCLVLAGDFHNAPAFEKIAEYGERYDANPAGFKPEAPLPIVPKVAVKKTDSNQSHLRVTYTLPIDNTNQHEVTTLDLIGTVLGGSMSSILFDEIREQRGLCYSVSARSFDTNYHSGIDVSSGLNTDKCVEAYELIRELTEGLKDSLTEETLLRGKKYLTGSTAMSLESNSTVARRAAAEYLEKQHAPDVEAGLNEIESVTLADAVSLLERLENPVTAVVGNHEASDFSS